LDLPPLDAFELREVLPLYGKADHPDTSKFFFGSHNRYL